MLANGDNWWLGIVNDFNKTNCSIEEAAKLIFDLYFSGIKGYFYVDDKGFVESNSYKEKHSGIEMLKVEGTATNGKFESIGECWIYGYVFFLGDTPCGMIGMNNKDKSEEAKAEIKMYIDTMVDTLVLK